jgi:hypothetical protein
MGSITSRELTQSLVIASRDGLQVATAEVLARRLAVDHQDAVAGDQADARHRVLAPTGAVVIVLTTLWHG